MNAYQQLSQLTRTDREYLHSAPVIIQALIGQVSRELYLAFLSQAYHHVQHTVPLLMAVGMRLDASHHWLMQEIVEYLQEEIGHDQWILDDIAAAGGDARAVEESAPSIQTDAMIAFAYDTVMRRNPAAFFGMVFVLEGTSAALALTAADRIQSCLGLPDAAFTYLRSHGKLDQEHIQHLASILERLDAIHELPAVVSCARGIYWLYGNMFRSLEGLAAMRAQDALAERAACA